MIKYHVQEQITKERITLANGSRVRVRKSEAGMAKGGQRQRLKDHTSSQHKKQREERGVVGREGVGREEL